MSDIVRKLATIRTIGELRPIPGADFIEVAQIDGWEVIVKKGDFAVGDPCVYFEIDSFLPVRPEFEFLRKACFKSTAHLGDGFRLRTIKMKATVSTRSPRESYSRARTARPVSRRSTTLIC